MLDTARPYVYHPRMKMPLLFALASAAVLPLMGQEPEDARVAPITANGLEDSLNCLETVVLPALLSATDRESADAAAIRLEQSAPHIRQLAHVLVEELTPAEEQEVLPLLAPRMKGILSQLDRCCRRSAELLSDKPAACGSESLTRALTGMLDNFMGIPATATERRTDPAGIPLALAEADAQLASASALLASLERLQSAEAVERELPTIRKQLEELRSQQEALSDSTRWTKTQLFLIMQRTRTRGVEIVTDLGKSTAALMGLNPPCYGSAELEAILTKLLNHTSTTPVEEVEIAE